MRLYEGMILRPLGFEEQIVGTGCPGKAVDFWVTPNVPDVELLVDRNRPDEPGRLWGSPIIRLTSESYRLRFIAFFDRFQLDPRDFRLLEVSIAQMDERPELVGRHALVELASCSIWRTSDENQGTPAMNDNT